MSGYERAVIHPWLVVDHLRVAQRRPFGQLAWSIATPESEEAERTVTARYRLPLRHLPRTGVWDDGADLTEMLAATDYRVPNLADPTPWDGKRRTSAPGRSR